STGFARGPNVRFGSKADIKPRPHRRPLYPRKRTLQGRPRHVRFVQLADLRSRRLVDQKPAASLSSKWTLNHSANAAKSDTTVVLSGQAGCVGERCRRG